MEQLSSDWLRGCLDILVLSVLADGPKYGYRIQQLLQQQSGSRVDITPGTLYPLLHRLESDKLVRCKWDDSTGRRRKWYELTAAGKKQLVSRARQWQEYVDCIRSFLHPVLAPLPQPSSS